MSKKKFTMPTVPSVGGSHKSADIKGKGMKPNGKRQKPYPGVTKAHQMNGLSAEGTAKPQPSETVSAKTNTQSQTSKPGSGKNTGGKK